MKINGTIGVFYSEDGGETIVLEIDIDGVNGERGRLFIRSIDENKNHTWIKDIKRGSHIEISVE